MTTKSFRGKNLTVFSGFRGVDFSSSPLDVDGHRASDMENFISDFGILRKRHGFEQIREFTDGKGNRLPVCGIFHYKTDEVSHVIVHAGDRFLRLTENGYERIGADIGGLTATRSEVFAQKGRLYIIGCGDFLVYGTWDEGKTYELRRMYDSEDVYIPTTSIGIGGEEGAVTLDDVNLLTPRRKNKLNGVSAIHGDWSYSDYSINIDTTFNLDSRIEMLSEVTVKNIKDDKELVVFCGDETDEHAQGAPFYDKDGGKVGHRHIDANTAVTMYFDNKGAMPTESFELVVEVEWLYKRNQSVGEPMIKTENILCTCIENKIKTVEVKNTSNKVVIKEAVVGSYAVDPYEGKILLQLNGDGTEEGESVLALAAGIAKYNYLHSHLRSYTVRFKDGGGIDQEYKAPASSCQVKALEGGPLCLLDYCAGTLCFFYSGATNTSLAPDLSDITPSDDGEDVLEVTFYAHEEEEEGVVPYSERIKGCRFGTLFGVDGATDRLFLAGNPRLKNTEFFSEMDDYSYFPDVYTATVGSPDVAIVGYQRLADSTLAVFKEKQDMGDATIYYRSSHYKEYVDEDGMVDRIDPVFPTVPGNIGEAMISRIASRDFGGDRLFLSENGVFAVVLSENITVGERYSRERSRMVNARLTREKDLSEAVSIVYKNKYYLAVNGNVYVADSRYRSTRSDNLDGAWNYEWYFLTDVPARVLAEIEGELWFGTEDGRLCRFDEQYSDRTYTLYEPGDIALSDHKIKVNTTVSPAPRAGDGFITTSPLYAVAYEGFSEVKDGYVYHADRSALANMAEGEKVYLELSSGASSEALNNGALYEMRDIDLMEGRFSLYLNGKRVTADTASFYLIRPLKGIMLDVVGAEAGSLSLGLYGKELKLVSKSDDPLKELVGKLVHRRAVVARWISPVTGLGTAMAGKTLHRLSITCEPTVRGKLTFGYDARLSALRKQAQGGAAVFSLDSLDFSSFSFETGFASSYSVRVFERNVNYLALVVESDTDTACAFNRLEIYWNYRRLNGGLR